MRQLRAFAQIEPNINLRYGSESPIKPLAGVPIADVFGNVWQWCEDHFNPLSGFRINKLYDDFSTPCFDGAHQLIMGGSFMSTGDESSQWARFHFRPHFFQHAGFRLVKSCSDGGAIKLGLSADRANPYEAATVLTQYMTLHYAPDRVQFPYNIQGLAATSFPQRCAKDVIDWMDKLALEPISALDIGCAVGGAAFSLADRFQSVTAVDLSEALSQRQKSCKIKDS